MQVTSLKQEKNNNTYIQSTSPLYQVRGIHKTLWMFVKVSVAGLGFQPS